MNILDLLSFSILSFAYLHINRLMNTVQLVTWSFQLFGALLIRDWWVGLFCFFQCMYIWNVQLSTPYKNGTSYAVLL